VRETPEGILEKAIECMSEQQAEIRRLKLAIALRKWVPPKKRGGRPVKRTVEEDVAFFEKLDKFCALSGIAGRGALPKLWRMLNDEKPPSERLNKVKLEQEIKSLQTRRSAVRRLLNRQ